MYNTIHLHWTHCMICSRGMMDNADQSPIRGCLPIIWSITGHLFVIGLSRMTPHRGILHILALFYTDVEQCLNKKFCWVLRHLTPTRIWPCFNSARQQSSIIAVMSSVIDILINWNRSIFQVSFTTTDN